MLYVDTHGERRPSRAHRERSAWQRGSGKGSGPRARRSEPGPRISWGCAGNRRRSRRGPRCRVRTGSGLCGSRLFPHECAAPAGGVAETVSGGHGPHGRRAGRRSGSGDGSCADGQHHTRRVGGGQSDWGRKATKSGESRCFATIGRMGRSNVRAIHAKAHRPAPESMRATVSLRMRSPRPIRHPREGPERHGGRPGRCVTPPAARRTSA
ncbi:hypothetical protein BURCENBC7_AP3611 [Burkholderia cenocepacia BC7]|nr:hypothetical protein BURCENBC7_AP3611 [Burkholderia cenocepacia BC7]